MENLQNYSDYRKKYHPFSPFFPLFSKKKVILIHSAIISTSSVLRFYGYKVLRRCAKADCNFRTTV